MSHASHYWDYKWINFCQVVRCFCIIGLNFISLKNKGTAFKFHKGKWDQWMGLEGGRCRSSHRILVVHFYWFIVKSTAFPLLLLQFTLHVRWSPKIHRWIQVHFTEPTRKACSPLVTCELAPIWRSPNFSNFCCNNPSLKETRWRLLGCSACLKSQLRAFSVLTSEFPFLHLPRALEERRMHGLKWWKSDFLKRLQKEFGNFRRQLC